MDFTTGLPRKPETTPAKRKSGNTKLYKKPLVLMGVGAVIVLAASVSAAVYFFFKYSDVKKRADETSIAQDTKNSIADAVRKIYAVPNEEPTLARVNDPTQLGSEQAFFKAAKQGDYVLVYPKAQLAILYRESAKQIINVGPVSVGADTAATPEKKQ